MDMSAHVSKLSKCKSPSSHNRFSKLELAKLQCPLVHCNITSWTRERDTHTHTHTHINTYIHVCICLYVFMSVRAYVCMHACMCVYVCMYVCMHACMYGCLLHLGLSKSMQLAWKWRYMVIDEQENCFSEKNIPLIGVAQLSQSPRGWNSMKYHTSWFDLWIFEW